LPNFVGLQGSTNNNNKQHTGSSQENGNGFQTSDGAG
jgi:hypothetical protein